MAKQAKTLQTAVGEALNNLALHFPVDSPAVTLHVVPVSAENAPLEQQVIRFDTGRIIVPGNLAKDAFPDYSDKDNYAEHCKQFRIGALAGVPLFYQHNPLVKPLLENNRRQEYLFWSWLTTSYCAFAHELHALGEKETRRHAHRVLNNARTSENFGSIGMDYAAQLVLRFGSKALRQVVGASTTAEIHDMVRPREALFCWYAQQQGKHS